ncbi:hypothetical protein ACRALDRAFT_1094109 [Sodiomyces alcalophilus JCM 7366]|uniref:uncharacterized protein n=1 Tax=Sodiomyces alcalophilus JCM 7366 TaxID=591952 RepID=UPI0039B6950F
MALETLRPSNKRIDICVDFLLLGQASLGGISAWLRQPPSMEKNGSFHDQGSWIKVLPGIYLGHTKSVSEEVELNLRQFRGNNKRQALTPLRPELGGQTKVRNYSYPVRNDDVQQYLLCIRKEQVDQWQSDNQARAPRKNRSR